jgi:hypothetical protein
MLTAQSQPERRTKVRVVHNYQVVHHRVVYGPGATAEVPDQWQLDATAQASLTQARSGNYPCICQEIQPMIFGEYADRAVAMW